MTKYDESFDPPAPIAEVVLRKIETGERVRNILMLLDTGADVSLLPSSALRLLKAAPVPNENFRLEGYNSNEKTVEVFQLQVIFLGKRFTGKYCAVDDEIGILGRDILNQISLLFDGRNLIWQETVGENLEN